MKLIHPHRIICVSYDTSWYRKLILVNGYGGVLETVTCPTPGDRYQLMLELAREYVTTVLEIMFDCELPIQESEVCREQFKIIM